LKFPTKYEWLYGFRPGRWREREPRKELALYQRQVLSFGKARALAQVTRWEFEKLLGERKVIRHYSGEDMEEDIRYAGGRE